MATMCCIGCNGASVTLGGSDHTIVDDAGRSWFFEMHPYAGPIVLRRRDGQPKAVQPGSRSPFWAAFNRWNAMREQRAC